MRLKFFANILSTLIFYTTTKYFFYSPLKSPRLCVKNLFWKLLEPIANNLKINIQFCYNLLILKILGIMQPSYQLTKYPVGTLSEIWAVSWPLMISLATTCIMNFANRAFLAYYNVDAMNAVTVSGTFAFIFLAFFQTIAEVTTVFVGKFHGNGQNKDIAKPIWQILWLILFCSPILFVCTRLIAPYLFAENSLEARYFVRLLDFSPAILSSFALMGFFLALGKTKIITVSSLLTNVVNVILAPICIFGYGIIPEMGIDGAAIATGVAQSIQTLFLLYLFLKKSERKTYHTHTWHFDKSLAKEMLILSMPSGFGRSIESLAHGCFLYLLTFSSKLQLTSAVLAQSFYILIVFFVYGISKGVTAVVANLVGAKKTELIPKTIFSAFFLHTLVFTLLLGCILLFDKQMVVWLLHPDDRALFDTAEFAQSVTWTMICMSFFFLLKGLSWIMIGVLTSYNDTKFVMHVNTLLHVIGFAVPTYIVIRFFDQGAIGGWTVMALNSLLVFLLFWQRAVRKHQVLSNRVQVDIGKLHPFNVAASIK